MSVPRLHWAMWVINDSLLPDLPIHILITLWFLATLSIRAPFHPGLHEEVQPGPPREALLRGACCQSGCWAGPEPQTQAERGGPRRSHLPWPACPLGPKPQRCQGSLPSAPHSFCLLFLSQLFHSAAPGRPALRSPGLQGPIKASGQRPARTCCILSAHLKTPAPPGSATKKRGRPRAHWLPEAPRTQKGRRQRHFLGWQVLVSDSTQSTGGQRKAGVGFGQAGSADTQFRAPQG